MRRTIRVGFAALAVAGIAATPAATAGGRIGISRVVDVSRDQLSQNETPIAINPANPSNMITGANDWNYNDGCAVNTTADGGASWTPTLPDGFLPGITSFTNDPNVAGTGAYDAGGDPTIAFSPDGKVAYYVCQAFDFTSPFDIALLLNRSYDGGFTWQKTGLVQVSAFSGNGTTNGSNGKFPDHENIYVDPITGYVYLTWAEFSGNTHSPVYVAVSHDQGGTWTLSKITAGNVRNNQDQRVVTDPSGNAYLVFDNGVQGGKGTVLYVSKSTNGGLGWSAPVQFAALTNPVCVFPPYCFNISGGQFRAPGSYPAPAFDPTTGRLYVAYTDIVNGEAQVLMTYANVSDITKWSAPVIVAPASGDRINVELSVEPSSGRLDLMTNDRSYTGNTLFDVSYITSADGGSTWSTTRVTKTSWDPSAYGVPCSGCTNGVRPFIGDYDGITSLPTSAAMTWTGPGKTFGTYPTNLEVYFASVTP